MILKSIKFDSKFNYSRSCSSPPRFHNASSIAWGLKTRLNSRFVDAILLRHRYGLAMQLSGELVDNVDNTELFKRLTL